MNPGSHTLFVNYNQEARKPEMFAARKIARTFNARHHESAIYQHDAEAEHAYADTKGIIPMRNCLLISLASVVGKNIYCKSSVNVIIGAQHGDDADFADCRPGFIKKMNDIAQSFGVTVEAPLINKTRSEIVRLAEQYDMKKPFMRDTWSCYRGNVESGPCGLCLSCLQ